MTISHVTIPTQANEVKLMSQGAEVCGGASRYRGNYEDGVSTAFIDPWGSRYWNQLGAGS